MQCLDIKINAWFGDDCREVHIFQAPGGGDDYNVNMGNRYQGRILFVHGEWLPNINPKSVFCNTADILELCGLIRANDNRIPADAPLLTDRNRW